MKSLKLTARLCLVEFCTIHIALLDRLIYISLNLFFVLDSVHKSFYNISVRSKNHECDTVDCLDTCSKDRKLSAANYLEEFIFITCRAEVIHEGIFLLGWLSLLSCLLCGDPLANLPLFAAIAAVLCFGNLPFAMIQRYNRRRLEKLWNTCRRIGRI